MDAESLRPVVDWYSANAIYALFVLVAFSAAMAFAVLRAFRKLPPYSTKYVEQLHYLILALERSGESHRISEALDRLLQCTEAGVEVSSLERASAVESLLIHAVPTLLYYNNHIGLEALVNAGPNLPVETHIRVLVAIASATSPQGVPAHLDSEQRSTIFVSAIRALRNTPIHDLRRALVNDKPLRHLVVSLLYSNERTQVHTELADLVLDIALKVLTDRELSPFLAEQLLSREWSALALLDRLRTSERHGALELILEALTYAHSKSLDIDPRTEAILSESERALRAASFSDLERSIFNRWIQTRREVDFEDEPRHRLQPTIDSLHNRRRHAGRTRTRDTHESEA